MNILIMSQKEALHYKPEVDKKTAIIRIHEPNESVLSLKHEGLFEDELYVFFHDVEFRKDYYPDDIKLMSLLDVKRIVNYVLRHQNVDTLIIHCHAGVSRSSAVAMAVSWILKLPLVEETIMSDYYAPNLHVLTLFAEVLNVRKEKSALFKELTKRRKEGLKAEPFTW